MTTVLSCRCMPVSSLVELVLLRHGIAEARLNGLDHPERALTTLGRQRTRLMIETLVGRGLEVDRLITSPYRRAMETAQIALQAGLAPVLDVDEQLSPGGEPLALLQGLRGRIALVGHEPDLGHLACRLLGLTSGLIVLKKAGLVQLRSAAEGWQLAGLLRPGQVLDRQV